MYGMGREIKSSTNRTVGSGRVVSREKSRFQEGDIALNFKKGGGGSMANGHDGARIGARQEKKALADKLTEGNPGKRKLTVMEFSDTADLSGEQMPPPRDYLAAQQKNGREMPSLPVMFL